MKNIKNIKLKQLTLKLFTDIFNGMKIIVSIPNDIVDKVIRGIMENFPEASNGSAMVCNDWKYETLNFSFMDTEEGRQFKINKENLTKAFEMMFTDKWPKGLTQPPISGDWELWNNWLCQSDANDFDAFVQLACFDEVIYG